MKQIIQDIKSGETQLEHVPVPKVKKGQVLIKTHSSLVSLGTERMLVEFGKANYLEKALQQPEKVKQVVNKVKSDGLIPTIKAVSRKLDAPMKLGYCNSGEIVAVGEDVKEFQVGDRVASNGPHAEYVLVPTNLVAKLPDNVSYQEGSFAVIGSIGLHGMRLSEPTFGETFVVIGLGLVGLLTAEMLKSSGCEVIGFDFDKGKIELAKTKGIKAFDSSEVDPVDKVKQLTGNIGSDGILITASTKSNEVISQAARMSRKRGRIVLVGVVGLDINRSDFYEKELSFRVSCSYGPGRYDPEYEHKGFDYPIPYVRWTEKRNFEAVLRAISEDKLNVKTLITRQLPFEKCEEIYQNLDSSDDIAVILDYNVQDEPKRTIKINETTIQKSTGSVGIIGAGNFTQSSLLPNLKKNNARIRYIASSGGVSGSHLAEKYGIEYSTTDYQEILNDSKVDGVIITTRHNLHAQMVIESLKSGKHVFVEKPLTIKRDHLEEIIKAKNESGKSVTVGFNRRFSPHMQKAKELLGENSGPINVIGTMNAGFIPDTEWVHDMEIGGGRIIGEACHYIDLITFLTGSQIREVFMEALGTNPSINTDNATLTLKYHNGSLGVINYFSNGNKSYSKERVEIYSQGKNLIMDNFRKMYGYGFKGFSKLKTRQDKGHANQFTKFMEALETGGEVLIPFEQIVNTTEASFAAIESLKMGKPIELLK